MIRKRLGWFSFGFFGVFGGLVAILMALGGCGGAPAAKVEIPASVEKELFALADAGRPEIVLSRSGKDYSHQPEKGFRFCVADGVENTGGVSIALQSVEEDIRLQVRPGNRIKFEARSLVISDGSTRMEFHKLAGEYRIKLPTASLGIRGTKLEATVASDGTSLVRLFEGAVTISSQDGTETPLKEGDSALLRGTAAPELNPPDSSIPAFIKDLNQDEVRKAIQKM